jgi:hypothetical protein
LQPAAHLAPQIELTSSRFGIQDAASLKAAGWF